MPHFGFTSPWSWLSYRVGWLFGAGVTEVVTEARHLTERTKDPSRAERSAWLFRCVISCALVGAEVGLCLRSGSFGIRGWIMRFRLPLVSSAVLLVLPRPHVRWPLFGRAVDYVLVTYLRCWSRAHVDGR